MNMITTGRRAYLRLLFCFALICFALTSTAAFSQSGGELRFCLRSEPKTFDPLLVDDHSSLSIRYLTGGVLVRANRKTQDLEPELAESWKVSKDGKQITFKLRRGITFSDGSPFSSEDVAFTMQRLMDPALHSSTGDAFRSGSGAVSTKIIAPDQIAIIFPAPLAGLERLFDQVAIMSAHSPKKEAAVLGPFLVAEYKAGSSVLLRRNPNYWKKDSQGHRLPYLDSIRLDIQSNRDVEMLRFKRGELDLINVLDSNAGKKPRERMAVMVQEDLGKLGIKVNVVTLDFPSLIERISQKFNYEAAMLGFRNVDLDPNGQMNIWLSSAEDHAWNPQQKSPETAWEAEIDRLMRAQAYTADPKKRKENFDRVQERVAEQTQFIYLVNLNALSAVSNAVVCA